MLGHRETVSHPGDEVADPPRPLGFAFSPAAIRRLPPAIQDPVIQALSRSIHSVFLLAVPLALAAFVVTWFLRENPLRETAHIGIEVAAGEPLVPEVEERAAAEHRHGPAHVAEPSEVASD